MSNIVTKDLFVGTINLAKDDIDNLNLLIEEFEKEVLIYLLGHDLYEKLKSSPNAEPYKSLIDGKSYVVTYNGVDYNVEWEGLKNPIKYYVYCNALRNQVSSTTANGEVVSTLENSALVGISNKVMTAWRKFETYYGSIYDYSYSPTAYNYLKKFKADFPTWIFSELNGSINSHDL